MHRGFFGRLTAIATLVVALVAPAAAQRPVPVGPNAPPPDPSPTPYPVPVPKEDLPPPSDPPPPPPTTTPTTPAPTPPTPTPTPTPPVPTAPTPTPTPTPPAPTPTPTPPTPPPPAQPTTPAPEPAPAPTPAPAPATPSQVDPDESYPQYPLVGTATIKSFKVHGNKKTDADTVIYIAGLDKGDDWSADMVEPTKNRLISSGLFKDVDVYWSMVPGGVKIHLQVQDKHSWVIAPAFYNQPTNVGGGIGFGENNLFGQNQKLLLYGQIATGESFFIGAWVIPAIANTRWFAQLDTYLKSARNIEYASPTAYLDTTDVGIAGSNPQAVRESRIHYLNGGVTLGIELFRGFKLGGRLRGAKVSYKDIKLLTEGGATTADVACTTAGGRCFEVSDLPAPGAEGWDISNEVTLVLDRRANYYGIQSGYRLGASFEHSLESLGSDFNYWLGGVNFYRAQKILDRHNFVVRGSLGRGKNLPFQQEYQTGGTTMRGWLNNQFRGDFKAIANVEYSMPILPTIYGLSIRGLVFWDSAYTTFITDNGAEAKRNYLPNARARGLDPFKNTVGVGTRLYLRQIVLPLLGLDVGYGLEARDVQVYLAIGITD